MSPEDAPTNSNTSRDGTPIAARTLSIARRSGNAPTGVFVLDLGSVDAAARGFLETGMGPSCLYPHN